MSPWLTLASSAVPIVTAAGVHAPQPLRTLLRLVTVDGVQIVQPPRATGAST